MPLALAHPKLRPAAARGASRAHSGTPCAPRARDALDQLEHDHMALRRLVQRCERLALPGATPGACAEALDQLCDALALQMKIEHELILPLLHGALGDQAQALGALGEHSVLRALIARLDELSPGDHAGAGLVRAIRRALQPARVLEQLLVLAQLGAIDLDTRALGEQMIQCRRRHQMQPQLRIAGKVEVVLAWPPAFRLTRV
jgi:hypothetical protein